MIRRLTVVVLTAAVLGGGAQVALASSSPTVSTGAASSVADTSAALNGTVNPGGAATTYHFEWGLTTAYGVSSKADTLAAGTTSDAVKVGDHRTAAGHHLPLSDRRDQRVRHRRSALDRTFKTLGTSPPGVSTGPGATLGPFSASVTGVVNPAGAATTWYFQYGLTTAYTAQTLGGTVPIGVAPVTVSQMLPGLQPGVTFHYRLVAVHGGSAPQYGADQTVSTEPWPAPAPRVIARTRPRADAHSPFVFTTSGAIVAPAWDSGPRVCFENATVDFYAGRRLVQAGLASVQPNCTFSLRTALPGVAGIGGGRRVHLTVRVHFRGNGWLAPANARPQRVTVG